MTTSNPNDVVPRGLIPCDAASFAMDAVELAWSLLDKYLFCPQSGVGYVRIIETEGYPVNDAVYSEIFGDDETQRALPDRAGVLFRMSSRLHFKPVAARRGPVVFPDYLYVTAERSGEAGALRPVVLIRSCVPHFCGSLIERNPAARKFWKHLEYDYNTKPNNALKGLLINPHMVAALLEPDFESSPPSDPVLYDGAGCRLYSCPDLQDPVFRPVLWGKRVLELRQILGLTSTFRFLLATDIPRSLFMEHYKLDFMTVSSEEPPQALAAPSQVVMDPQQMVMDPQQMVMDPQQMVMDPQQMVMGPQGILMSPPQVPVSGHQDYVPLGPPQAPMGPPSPEFPHYWPP